MQKISNWLNRNKDVGILILRLFIAFRIIYGVIDNIFEWNNMINFRNFLDSEGFPFPLISAMVSVYVQLIAGVLIVVGWNIRIAAAFMIINFLIASLIHIGQPFEQMTPALTLFFINVLFLFYGAGKYALDKQTDQKVYFFPKL